MYPYPPIHQTLSRTYDCGNSVARIQDSRDWEALTGNEQHFISMVLAFFAASDGIVMENLVSVTVAAPYSSREMSGFFFLVVI